MTGVALLPVITAEEVTGHVVISSRIDLAQWAYGERLCQCANVNAGYDHRETAVLAHLLFITR